MQVGTGRERTGRRRSAAVALVVSLFALGIVVLATPAAAAPIAGSAVTNVTAGVGPQTPLWTLDVTFSVTGFSCPAELHYKVSTSAGRHTICRAGETPPSAVTVQRPVFAPTIVGLDTLTPGSTAGVQAKIYPAGSTLENNPGGTTWQVPVPPAPVWVGVGDGYTSGLNQAFDGDAGSYTGRDAASSWITAAADALNGQFNVPGPWQVAGHVIATESATAQALGSQITQMTSLLQSRRGSWNWVGVSAGLVDSGIPQVLQSWYEAGDDDADWNRSPANPESISPWEVFDAADCPDFSGVRSTIAARATAMRSGRQGVVTAAKAADPSVRVINLLYPYLTDVTNAEVRGERFPNDQYANPCANPADPANNRVVINELNAAIDVGTADTNVFTLDLRTADGFGDRPTGTRVYQEGQAEVPGEHDEIPAGIFRPGSLLQLTRPLGYPYPSGVGAVEAGSASVDIAIQSGADTTAPTVTGTPVRAPDKNGWYNRPVEIVWSADDGPTGDDLSNLVIPRVSAGSEGRTRRWMTSREVCDNESPPNCAHGYIDLSTDFTPPSASTALTGATPNSAGWYKSKVTVSWRLGSDNLSGVDTSTLPPNVEVTGGGVVVVKNPANTLCDRAGNCAKDVAATVKVDGVDPVVTGVILSSQPKTNGWYRTPVTVDWTVTDQGGSGVNPATVPADDTWAGDVEEKELTSPKACDIADRCSTGSVTFSIDQTQPSVRIDGAEHGASYEEAPTITCVATDEGSGVQSCKLTETVSALPDGEGFSYTVKATATDVAGNTRSKTITYTQLGVTHLDSSWVTGNAAHVDAEYGFVTTAIRLRCFGDESASSNSIQVNWGRGSRFRLDDVGSSLCYDDPTIDAGMPVAASNTFIFTGTGAYNGVPGATIQLRVTDAGEPGIGVDEVDIVVLSAGGQTVLETSALVSAGNVQAHGADIHVPDYAFPAGGVFVVGDGASLGLNQTAYFWGSQWRQNNPMSGSAPASFEGFGSVASSIETPECGGTWSTRPGDSSDPPAAVPEYMAVIVSSNITKTASGISGDIEQVLLVKTNAGYGSAPGHVGTGTIVGVLCPT